MSDRPIRWILLAGAVFAAGPALAAQDLPDAGVTPDAGDGPSPAPEPEAASGQSDETEQTESTGGAGLFEQSVAAAESAPADSGKAPSESGGPAFELNGYTRGDLFVGKVPAFAQANMKAGYAELALVARAKREALGDAFAEVRLRYGMYGDGCYLQGKDQSQCAQVYFPSGTRGQLQQQTTVDVREAYVNAYLGPLDLRLGKQIIVWGRADLLNPTNNLTPFDFRMRSPIEDDRRIGNVGVHANVRLSPVRIEGVWLPNYVATELPTVLLPQYVSYDNPIYPKTDLDRGLLAGRVHLELPSVEMSASYVHGWAPLPGLSLTSLTIDPTNPQVLIARTAYKQQVVGFDFSTAIGTLVAIRGEAAYRRPYGYQDIPDYHVARPDLQYALGGDHTFGSVSVIVQYLGRYAFDWAKEEGPAGTLDPSIIKTESTSFLEQSATENINSQLRRTNQILFSQTARVQHLGTVRVEWLGLHEALSISALALVNFSTKEWMASPKIGYRLSDTLVAYLGAEILTGPSGTLFGLVDQQLSAGYAELRSTF
jgi:hypothetical protein